MNTTTGRSTSGWPTDDQEVEVVAKALFDFQVKEAVKEINKLSIRTEGTDDLIDRLRDESDTARVLVFSSYLEDRIKEIMTLRLRNTSSRAAERALFTNGPLASFRNRILIAYHLGWIDDTRQNELESFRIIRNKFAHEAYRKNLIDPDIASLFESMKLDIPDIIARMRDALKKGDFEYPIIESEGLSYDLKLLGYMSILLHQTMIDLIILPSAIAYRVPPSAISHGVDGERPTPVRILELNLARSLLKLFHVKARTLGASK